jgi:hypothetical protein
MNMDDIPLRYALITLVSLIIVVLVSFGGFAVWLKVFVWLWFCSVNTCVALLLKEIVEELVGRFSANKSV